MKIIQLTRCKTAIVDDVDYVRLIGYRWHAHYHKGKWYARSNRRRGGIYTTILMHRLILGAASGRKVDHRNGDGLDNRRENLRECTHGENVRNRIKSAKCQSPFKGVSLHKPNGKWRARIKVNGHTHYLGNYATELEAAKAYDAAAARLHGEFASLNA